jgi:hypothetical protein
MPGYVASRSFQVVSVRPPEISAVSSPTTRRISGFFIAILARRVTSWALE